MCKYIIKKVPISCSLVRFSRSLRVKGRGVAELVIAEDQSECKRYCN